MKSCFVRGSSSFVALQLKKPNVNSNRRFFSIKLNQWLWTPMAINTNGTFVTTKILSGVWIFLIAFNNWTCLKNVMSNWYVSCNSTWIWSLSILFNLTCQFLSRSITSELTISLTICFVRGSSSAFCSLTAEETER